MVKLAFFVRLEAKPGKETEVQKFLDTALTLAKEEKTTLVWFSLRLAPGVFGVFDGFADEAGRQAHLNGPIGQALMARADELFARPPSIEPIEITGLKNTLPAA